MGQFARLVRHSAPIVAAGAVLFAIPVGAPSPALSSAGTPLAPDARSTTTARATNASDATAKTLADKGFGKASTKNTAHTENAAHAENAASSGNGYSNPFSSTPADQRVYRGSGVRAPIPAFSPAEGVQVVDATASAKSSGGGEPSIAVDPTNTDHIAIARFNVRWSDDHDADLLYSTNGGSSWTDQTINKPTGASVDGCPCDQGIEYGRDGTLYGTFLAEANDVNHIYTGTTTDPTKSWSWRGNPAQGTTGTRTHVDQPWILVNRDPDKASQDNTYVAYDDFGGGPDGRVAVSYGAKPVDITADQIAATETPIAANPGLRMAADPRSGTMYALYQQSKGGQPKAVTYKLNRSTDGGRTWTLNGNTAGITVDTADSDQGDGYKFGTVNALFGGVDHAAVDPTNGDVYVVYGRHVDKAHNQIVLRRLTADGSGGLGVGPASVVSSSNDAALPSVAVTGDGTVGVLYDSHDADTSDGFPTFTAHFARSTDHGKTFSDVSLAHFQSPVKNDKNDAKQRPLGDYQEVEAVGNSFYGTFAGNTTGVPTKQPAIDAVFFTVSPQTPPPTKTPSTLVYTGPTTADYHDGFRASATLTAGGSPLAGQAVHFSLGQGGGSQSCSGTTNGSGVASCPLTPNQKPGATSLTASFGGTSEVDPSSTSVPFTVTREETTVAYTGPGKVANGVPAHLSAVLKEDGEVPIAGRTVTIGLGTGSARQTCHGTTAANGVAACTIPLVDQDLNATATVPVSVAFDGDDYYRPSSGSATVRLEYYTGRAYGISGNVNLPLTPLRIDPTPDTGPVRTAHASSTNTPCTAALDTILVSAHALCPNVTTSLAPGTSVATSQVQDTRIGIPGLPLVELSGVRATSTTTCAGSTGTASLELKVAGEPVQVDTAPNSTIDLGAARLVIDEQKPVVGADQGLTVNAVHLTGLGGLVDIVVGEATSDAHNCT